MTEIEMTVEHWVNLLKRHLKASARTLEDFHTETIFVLAEGPMLLPPGDHAYAIFQSREQWEFWQEYRDEIFDVVEVELAR